MLELIEYGIALIILFCFIEILFRNSISIKEYWDLNKESDKNEK